MKKKIDDLLNKYVDNELVPSELEEITSLIDKDEDTIKNLKAIKLVEQSLRRMEFDNSPDYITSSVMQKIGSLSKAKKSNWFFWLVMSLFTAGIALCLFFVFKDFQPAAAETATNEVVGSVKEFIGDKSRSFGSILKGADFKLVGTILTLLIGITGYFVFENHRNFRNKLKSL